jgi:hypothetical protein
MLLSLDEINNEEKQFFETNLKSNMYWRTKRPIITKKFDFLKKKNDETLKSQIRQEHN